MTDAGEIERFQDRCSDLMRELLSGLAQTPDQPRPFPEIEDAIGWPRRRIASVLGGVSHMRHTEFGGRRPYRFLSDRGVRLWSLGDVDGRRAGTSLAIIPRVPPLTAKQRAKLPNSAFAYIDSDGRRRLPIHDAAHVRNALARFGQVALEDDEARDRARSRLLRAAKKARDHADRLHQRAAAASAQVPNG